MSKLLTQSGVSSSKPARRCSVRHFDEDRGATFSIELSVFYDRASSSNSTSNSNPQDSKNSTTSRTASTLPVRDVIASLSVEVLAWSSDSLYSRVFNNESWEADIVYEELKDSTFKFSDCDSYVQLSLSAGMILLQIPKLLVEKNLQGDAAEIQKLKLSNRTLNHRMAAVEHQLRTQKGVPSVNENDNESNSNSEAQSELKKLWHAYGVMEEAHKQAIDQLEEAQKQANGQLTESHKQDIASIGRMEECHKLALGKLSKVEASNVKLEHSFSKVEASNVKLEQANAILEQTLEKLMETDKKKGAYFCAGATSGKDGSNCMKWNSERVPLNKEFFLVSDDKTEVTIKEKGAYRFDAELMTTGSFNGQYIDLRINGTNRRIAFVCTPANYDMCVLSAILEINADDKAKVYCQFAPYSGSEYYHTFTIQHIRSQT